MVENVKELDVLVIVRIHRLHYLVSKVPSPQSMHIMKNSLSLFRPESPTCLPASVAINNPRNTKAANSRFGFLRRVFQTIVVACLPGFLASVSVHASDWAGGNGNWNNNGNPGWNGTGVPNAAGATANFDSGTTRSGVVLDIPITIGSLSLSGAGNLATALTLTNSLTLDGGGSGALISNTSTGTGSRLSLGSGSVVMNDNLTISNTNTNISGTQSIITGSSTVFSGTGNLTLSNASNDTANGQIVLGAVNTFLGSVEIQKGAVTISNNTGLGNAANAVTLGTTGAATLVSTGSSTSFGNNISVSATAGTKTLGSTSAAGSNSIFSGTILLNSSVNLTSSKVGADVRYTNVISGAGGVTTKGTGETQFGNGSTSITNTYAGNTTLTETSSLVLSDNAKMTFYIGATGVNNTIVGTAGQILTLDGDFVFDLSIAGTTPGNSWAIVDVGSLTETFSGTFTVAGFVDAGSNLWTKDINGTNFYRFSESTGVLAVVPEPATWGLLAFSLTTVLVFRRRRIS